MEISPIENLSFLFYSSFDILHNWFLIYHDDDTVYCMRIIVAGIVRNSSFYSGINHTKHYASLLFYDLPSTINSFFVCYFLFCY
jgi:hypothetical protein